MSGIIEGLSTLRHRITSARMGYLDLLKASALTYPSITVESTNAGAAGGPAVVVTVSNPGTTLTQAFEITARGECFFLQISKPTTVNSVNLFLELTLDGTILINDQQITATAGTGANVAVLMNGKSALTSPAVLPFETQLKVRVRFSGTPGGSENITVRYLAAYK